MPRVRIRFLYSIWS